VDEESRKQDILGGCTNISSPSLPAWKARRGEFYTPRSIVRVLVEILSPYKGGCLTRAAAQAVCCAIRKVRRSSRGTDWRPRDLWQESNPNTWKIARMNLGIRGIEGDLARNPPIRSPATCTRSQSRFRPPNPPFNMSDWTARHYARTNAGSTAYRPRETPTSPGAAFLFTIFLRQAWPASYWPTAACPATPPAKAKFAKPS